jgi:uncharacterized membrane protein YqjE
MLSPKLVLILLALILTVITVVVPEVYRSRALAVAVVLYIVGDQFA